MFKKGNLIDIGFIILISIVLFLINNFGNTDNLFKYSFIALLISYYAGRYATIISFKIEHKKNSIKH